VDEAGRGPLAGPVLAAAVILPERIHHRSRLWQLKDSKLTSALEREALFSLIEKKALDLAWAECSVEEIDRLNILQASLLAMSRAVARLKIKPDLCLVDGNVPLEGDIPSSAICKGDRYCLSIAAASIIAKVRRDRLMEEYHRQFPVYNFSRNKGYSTREHKEAIIAHGPCLIHRKTFKGVSEFL
jgi:ribonuclease HII